ncbi:MAG: Dps family protein [Burkholderiales bacterium]
MTINIGIDDSNRKAVADLLNKLLADEFVLYVKTRNFHWNAETPNFSELHKFFEGQYEALDETIDEVAERARALGGKAVATLGEYAKLTRLPETAVNTQSQTAMLSALLADHEALIRTLRAGAAACDEEYGDAGTADFLVGLMAQHEKTAWTLRAHLKGA